MSSRSPLGWTSFVTLFFLFCLASLPQLYAFNCTVDPQTLHLSDPPYENYFYSDCHSSNQVVVTSPLPDSDLTIIGPRLLVAWPAGNSGIAIYFEPLDGVAGNLGTELQNSSTSRLPLEPIYTQDNASANPIVGVSGILTFNSSATISLPILGSIRTIRSYTEGGSIPPDSIQDAIEYSTGLLGVALSRTWFDNVTTTTISFTETATNLTNSSSITVDNTTVSIAAGTYEFNASFNYPQLDQLSKQEVLNENSQNLITQDVDQTTSLSFLSYSSKLLAGAWRFLTYFGRDSMISDLLMQSVLSEGEGGAIEAVISAVLERLNKTDGSVCHEETIGDFATYLNLQSGIYSTAPQYDYKMIVSWVLKSNECHS